MVSDLQVTNPSSVQPLNRQRLARVVELLSVSFADEPNLLDLSPRRRARVKPLPRLFTALCLDASRHGRIDEARQGGQLLDVAVWLAPGAYPPDATSWTRPAPGAGRAAAT